MKSTLFGTKIEFSNFYVGIDIGTCHSVIARQQDMSHESEIIDSTVFVTNNGELVVGTEDYADLSILGCIQFLGKNEKSSDDKQKHIFLIPNRNGIFIKIGKNK